MSISPHHLSIPLQFSLPNKSIPKNFTPFPQIPNPRPFPPKCRKYPYHLPLNASQPFPAMVEEDGISKSFSPISQLRNPRQFCPKYQKYPYHLPLKATQPLPAMVEEDGIDGSPWEGAVVYRRDGSVSHVEYSTTLERLGMGRLCSEVSRDRTPVLVSVDVTRRRRRLKLDGIVRTVITLGCNRCGEPAAECIFSNFTLLLTEDPVEEPDKIDIGTIFGDDKSKNYGASGNGEGDDFEEDIDFDDTLYFPAEEKEIDISKHIRDIVHVEITINAICDANCRGLCLKCGTNLNKGNCNCSNEKPVESDYGPLKSLRKQMQ